MWCCPNCGSAATFSSADRPWPVAWRCKSCQLSISYREGIPCLAPDLADSTIGFDPKLFQKLNSFEDTNFWFVNRARLIVALLEKYFPSSRDFFEIGCGTGSVLQALRKCFTDLSLAGSELQLNGLRFARQRLGTDVMLLQMDARRIPAIGQFDVIGAFDVLEHIADDQHVLSQIYTALRPGGGAIIAVPQHRWLWSPEDEAACHVRRYARDELEKKIEKAGLRILCTTSFNAILLPLMLASRLRLRLKARNGCHQEALTEIQVGGWINGLLSVALALEVFLTSAGVRWPIGGSRFVVAGKPAT